MRAVWLREFGPPSVLVAGDAPEPAGESVIDVVDANVTFVETQVRAGRGPFPVTLPMIPGNGVGGHLVSTSSTCHPTARSRRRWHCSPDGRTATMLAEASAHCSSRAGGC